MNTPLPADDLMSRLRTPANWLSQGGGSWKDAISRYDRTPYEAADEIEQLRGVMKDLARAYVRLLESGRDRIISLGGECDSVDVMERGDPYLRKANEAVAKGACKKRLQQQVAALRHYCDPVHVAMADRALSSAGYSDAPSEIKAKGVSDERLSQLIAFAEACSKPWIGVDVVLALKELSNKRALYETTCDVCNGTEFVPVAVAPCEACYQRRGRAADKASDDMNLKPIGKCDYCGRLIWKAESIGRLDEMTQPNGRQCGGRFVAL